MTFEVKPYTAVNVQAVYEALAHRRAATRAYVLLHVPIDVAPQLNEIITDIAAVARGHGVGLITAEDPSNYETWEERVEAERHEPDPERLDEFLSTQMSDSAKRKISLRLR